MKQFVYYDRYGKYYGSFDEEELVDLRKYIIEDASSIVHMDYLGDYYKSPYYKKDNDYSEIINFKQELVKVEKDIYGKNRKIYHYSYDKKYYPYLVRLIDQLLNDDVSNLKEIYYPNLVKEMIPEYVSIYHLEKQLCNTDCNDLTKKLDLLYKLEYLTRSARDNRQNIKVLFYYEAVQEIMTLKNDKGLTLKK